ncbi:helitron_like_N domain-containing protein [Trichonephila clavipes]|nr:helitron_like_N domain-containing protein [Trichonephila clavipes]
MNVCMYVIDELKNYCTDSYENWYIYEFFHGEGLYNMLIDATHHQHRIPSATFRRFVNSKASRRSCIIIPPKRRAIGRSTPQARREEHYEHQNQTRRALRRKSSSTLRLTNEKVQGQIYHHAGSLLPLPDADHKFLQIYFMANSDEQIEQHCHYNAGTRRGILGALQGLFDQHNELFRLFKTAIQRMPADDYAVVIRADKRPVGQHERQFNAPTIDEGAIVIVGEEFESRDIILHRRSGDIQRVSETHRSYDGLQYPILFWRGDDGYHFNIKMINPRTGEGTNKESQCHELVDSRTTHCV